MKSVLFTPSQKNIRRTLNQPLPGHHPLSMIGISWLGNERLEHGGLRFFYLQKQRIIGIISCKKNNPAAGAHTAYADYFSRDITNAIMLKQGFSVISE